MKQRAAIAALLASILLLAGCSSGGKRATLAPTTTPTSTSATSAAPTSTATAATTSTVAGPTVPEPVPSTFAAGTHFPLEIDGTVVAVDPVDGVVALLLGQLNEILSVILVEAKDAQFTGATGVDALKPNQAIHVVGYSERVDGVRINVAQQIQAK